MANDQDRFLLSPRGALSDPQEKNLEEFFINRFGRELYATFFRDYTEKVWGMPCQTIPAEWGAQRVKGLSISKAIAHFLKTTFGKRSGGIAQKGPRPR